MISIAENAPCLLTQFVERVANGDVATDHLTVNSLKVGIRHERMSEFSDWSNAELDSIELHATQFSGDSPVDVVFELPLALDPLNNGVSVSNLCAPSPYAWT